MFDFPGGQVAAFSVTFAIGTVGFFIFRFLRIPSPAMLGPMTVTGALSAAGLFPFFNTRIIELTVSIMAGIMIGRLIDRTVVRRILKMAKPVAIQTVGMLALSMICGISMHLVSEIDLKTTLISSSAGGVTEMIIFGMAIDADISVVAFGQVFRLVFFLALMPYLGVVHKKITSALHIQPGKNTRVTDVPDEPTEFFSRSDYLVMGLMVLAGSSLVYWLNIPAGAMLGAMFASGGTSLYLNKHYNFDERLRFIVFVCIGLVTGARITPQFVAQFGALILPVALMTLIMLIGCFLLAIILSKTSELSLLTCLLCVTPAGITQAAVIAEEIGADPIAASIFQTARFLSIVTVFPWLVLPFI